MRLCPRSMVGIIVPRYRRTMRYLQCFFAIYFPAKLRYWCGGKGSLIKCSDRDEGGRPQGFVARCTILPVLAAVFLASSFSLTGQVPSYSLPTALHERLANNFENALVRSCGADFVKAHDHQLQELRATRSTERQRILVGTLTAVVNECELVKRDAASKKRAQELASQDARLKRARERVELERQHLMIQLEMSKAELERKKDELQRELARLTRLEDYCDNGNLYFRKTLAGFGEWVEEDESTGDSTPIAEFDLNNDVLNRLMELQAAGWKNKIPAKTVACGSGAQAIYGVLR